MEKIVTSTERLDASISSQHNTYGSTTLKNRASPTKDQTTSAEIHITTNRGALDTYDKNYDPNDSDNSVGHDYSSSVVVNTKELVYQSLPAPITTYTSSLFAAACSASSTSRFQAPHSGYARYGYSRMSTFIDETPGPKKSVWPSTTLQRFEVILFVLNQMCIGFVTIFMSWLCITNGLQNTPLHAWLVTLGYSLLMAEAVMVHYNSNPLTTNFKRHEKHTIHWVLQLAGGGLGMGGTLYKCIQKGFLLQSTHGKLGFATFILCLVSWLSGLTALYQLKLKSFVRPLFNRTIHNLIGLACFVLALSTQYYGYQTGFFRARVTSESFRDCMKTITLLSLVLSSIGPLKALLQKARTIFRDI
ncbi:PREDICTED: uncharacterized protein LOC108373638 [Rhagoletis zephyria]|uniref:uncharacterized protein LOC108373638 n=1 Tax=Rhagoletis zephyria TaxID=28612 RepID=UPI0008116769|nr:PREDICTED: uncharacterized protein LOC108373638 [Rhagoletis zephyria]